MDTTDELRKLLAERGVEWHTADNAREWATYWTVPTEHDKMALCSAYEFQGHLTVTMGYPHITPEQAVAATLGSSNCTNDCTKSERTETCRLNNFADVPFSVDYEIEGYDMGSGRDYATLAECSACGAYIIVPPEYHHVLTCDGDEVYQPYRFCPNCGRRVE